MKNYSAPRLADSKTIKEALITRLIELDLLQMKNERYSYRKVIQDASERGMNSITESKFSRYIQGRYNSLNDKEIVWLCLRYCVMLDPAIVSFFCDNKVNAYLVPYSDFTAIEAIGMFKGQYNTQEAMDIINNMDRG